MLMKYLKAFLSLIYPHLCAACGKETPPRDEDLFCINCAYHLPKTDFHNLKENAFTDRFWGRLPLEAASALFYFSKSGRVQYLIHELKYRGKRNVGVKCGEMLGQLLIESPNFKDIDMIIPVPLHPRRKQSRGYNQSDAFAEGLARKLKIPWSSEILIRVEMTETQTHKSRSQRFQNVSNAFVLTQAEKMKGKHVLLVDDVLTTGATLEACGLELLKSEGLKLSLASIAFAES